MNHDLLDTTTEPVRHDGTLTRLVFDRGFGFLSPHNTTGHQLFFHVRSLQGVAFDDLQEGDQLTFAEGLDRDGRRCAVDVRLMGDSASDNDGDDDGDETSDNWEASA